MTQGKLLEFLSDIGISISAGQLSNLLITGHQTFHTEQQEVYQAGLASSPWQHIDQTSARVGGENQTCNVVCNPLYTVYHTTAKKNRLTVLDVLQGGEERQFLLNVEAFELMETFNIPQKILAGLQHLPLDTRIGEPVTLLEHLLELFPNQGKQQQSRILEAAGIAAYHAQTSWPVVQALVCDDAPQFKLLTFELALCWVHEGLQSLRTKTDSLLGRIGWFLQIVVLYKAVRLCLEKRLGRHYKKLTPAVADHRQILDTFLDRYWDYYHQLLEYREQPSWAEAQRLRQQFRELFTPTTEYWELDERIKLTSAKESELLLVLEHPELPLRLGPRRTGGKNDGAATKY